MGRRKAALTIVFGLAAAVLPAARPARGAGFAIFDQSAGGMGMASAVAAQTDEPATLFYNPGGLAFFEGGAVSGGTVLYNLNESQYQGLSPGLGAGTTGERETSLNLLPHVWTVKPLRPGVVLGVGVASPFWLDVEWADPDGFSGRTLSLLSQIETWDLTTGLGFKLGEKVGLGLGAVLRLTQVSARWRLQRTNPLAGELQDVASFDLSTDTETGAGWTAGLSHRLSERFSWGLSYRSAVDVGYIGAGRLTQIPTGNLQFDELIAASFPFDQDLGLLTDLELPEVTTLGLAFGLSESVLLETDVVWTGWSSVQSLVFDLPNDPELSRTVPLRFDDTAGVRAGLRITRRSGSQWRFGYAFEESAQPDETLGPFLPDADRNIFAVGFGKDWLDLAFQWIQYDDRTTFTNLDDFNGTYRTNAWVVGLTITK